MRFISPAFQIKILKKIYHAGWYGASLGALGTGLVIFSHMPEQAKAKQAFALAAAPYKNDLSANQINETLSSPVAEIVHRAIKSQEPRSPDYDFQNGTWTNIDKPHDKITINANRFNAQVHAAIALKEAAFVSETQVGLKLMLLTTFVGAACIGFGNRCLKRVQATPTSQEKPSSPAAEIS